MTQTHIHLLITHLPIFESLLGAIVLAYGIRTKSNETKIAAYIILVISSIGAGIAYLTGEAAEETVEKIQGVVESTIKSHEEFALFAIISLVILGISSLFGLFLTRQKSPISGSISTIVLIIAMIAFGLVARTGYLGGLIRHTEISNTTPAVNSEEEEDDD